MTRVPVVRTYLELRSPSSLRRAARPDDRARVECIERCPASFGRYLYVEVGRAYQWRDRLAWTDVQYRERFDDPAVSLHILSLAGAPAGYFELQRHDDGSVEIVYFGLLPEFHGRGLGKYLLSEAVDAAWLAGASRVWLHTCTLDGEAALPNYLAHGFSPFKVERFVAELPE